MLRSRRAEKQVAFTTMAGTVNLTLLPALAGV
jgi:hypothetical protein